MKSDIKVRGDIKILVDSFYMRAANDPLLESIFFKIEKSHHKEALYTYWESVLLDSSDHGIRQFPMHLELMSSARHFIRWLSIFLKSIDDLYDGPNAEKAKVIVIRKSEEFQSSLKILRF